MSKDMYNLQIPITKELEKQLRALAEIDGRPIRTYCRRILQQYIEGNLNTEVKHNIEVTDSVSNEISGFDFSLED